MNRASNHVSDEFKLTLRPMSKVKSHTKSKYDQTTNIELSFVSYADSLKQLS